MYGIILDEKRTFEAEEIKNEKPQDWNKLGISENIKATLWSEANDRKMVEGCRQGSGTQRVGLCRL